jgi:hypothetical protein
LFLKRLREQVFNLLNNLGEATAHGCRLASCKKTARIFGSIKKICYFCSEEAIKYDNKTRKVEATEASDEQTTGGNDGEPET